MTLNTRIFEVFLLCALYQQWHVNNVVHKLGKPKHYFIPYFVLSNNLFQCWQIKDTHVQHHQHYIPKTILETWQRKIPILLLTKLWVSRLSSTVFGWFIQFDSTITAKTTQAQESLFCFQVTSEPFKYFQTLAQILRYSKAGLLSRFKLKCWPVRAQLPAVIHT